MKMQLLGTAAGDFPRVDDPEDNFAYLPRVRSLGGRNLRSAAQAMVFPDILVDFYNDRQLATCGIAAESVRHLVITHAHWDHLQPQRIFDFAGTLPHQLQVYGNHSVIEALQFVDTYDFDRDTGRFTVRETHADIGYHLLATEQTINVGDTRISAVMGNHGVDKKQNMILDKPCLNLVFEQNGKSIFYGLDSSYTLPLTLEFLRRFRLDAVVLDGTYGQWPIDVVNSGHHNLAMLVETIVEFRQSGIIHDETALVASHIAMAEVKPHDDLVEDFEREGITLGYDGMVVDV